MRIINRVINWLDGKYSRVTGRTHNYFVMIAYQPKGNSPYQKSTYQVTFSMNKRCSRDFYRIIRKEFAPRLVSAMPRHRLDNGKIAIETITYLGRY